MAITLGLVEAIDTNGVYVSMPGSRGVLRGPYETVQDVAVGDRVLTVTTDDGETVIVGLASAAAPRSTPATSTDNTVARFDGTGGALQTSGVTIDDNNNLSVGMVTSSKASSYNAQTVTSGNSDVYLTARAAESSGSGFIYHEYLNGAVKYFQHKISVNTFSMQYRNSGGTLVPFLEVDRNSNPGRVTIYQPGSTAGLEFGSSGPTITTGTGAPSHSAPNGSLYLRTDGTASTTLYVRAAGSWSALS